MKMRHAIAGICGTILIALIAFFTRDPPVRAEVAVVTRGPLRVLVEEEGRTRVRERYVVSSPIAGIVQRIEVHPGDRVGAGAVVASIAPTGTVVAPSAGIVLRLLHENEAAITPGTPLVEIGDPSDIEVEVEVLTQDAVRMKTGAPVRIVRWGGPPLAAHVDRIEPGGYAKTSALGVEEQRVRVICKLDSPYGEWTTLGDGYRVEVEITVEEIADAVLAPATATFRQRGDWAVYVVEGDRVRFRRVVVTQRAGALVAVSEGLRAGERVVEFPDDEISDGRRIEPLPRE